MTDVLPKGRRSGPPFDGGEITFPRARVIGIVAVWRAGRMDIRVAIDSQ